MFSIIVTDDESQLVVNPVPMPQRAVADFQRFCEECKFKLLCIECDKTFLGEENDIQALHQHLQQQHVVIATSDFTPVSCSVVVRSWMNI